MTRRILILLASFLALFGCFIAYQRIFAMPREGIAKRPPSVKDPSVMVSLTSTSRPVNPGTPTLGPGANLHVEARDKFNRLQYVLESPKWNRDPDGSWKVQKPLVTMYQKGGMVICIQGDEGTIFAEEIKGNVKINSGRLKGGVEISIDRNANQAAALAQRPRDAILIKMEDVSFDNNRLEISTPNEVSVTSYEADIEGGGLTINLNESPSELRLLRLERGRKMTIREEGLALSGPGGNAVAGRVTPTTGPAALAGGVAAQGVLEKIKSPSAQDAATELEAIFPQPTPDQGKPDSTGKKIPPPRNIYLAQFDSPDNNMNVISESGTLQNAGKVTLLFEWGGQPKRSGDLAAPAPASAPASPPSLPGKERKPTVITWSGPLELRPVGYVPKPNKKKYEVHAQGPQLTLADKQTIVSCGEVYFHQPGQTGELLGHGNRPVTVSLSSGETILADSVLFDRQRGVADLVGKGTITQPYRGGSELAIGGPTPETAPAPSEHPADDFIQWTKSVAVLFGESPADNAPTGKPKQYVKEATFYGHVELHRPTTGDSLQCEDNLRVWMARIENGKPILKQAVATGDVKAHYEKSDIEGQRLVMDFEAVKNGKGKIQNRPATLDVTGNVIVRTKDAKDPKNNSVVTADRIHANVIDQTAELYGSPATMVQDQKKVTGDEIHVAKDLRLGAGPRALKSAQVVGPGTADFPNDRDPLSDTKFRQPKPTHVTWARSMNFDGIANAADVKGDVHVDSELDKMRCQTVHLDFEKPPASAKPPAGQPSTGPAGPAAGQDLAMNIGGFGSRRIARIDAEGKVKVDSRKMDNDGHMIELLDLNCPNLIYTARDKTMIVKGAGNMLAGDFRQPPPAKKTPANPESEGENGPPVEDVQRPSASAFEWQRGMTLTQLPDGQRTVLLEGDVVLVHRSGKELELTDEQKKQWNVIDWQDLRPGRHIVLGCDNLQAAFDKPAEKGQPTTAQAEQGPRVGNLRNFQAWQDVNLKDGNFQVLGQRLIYDVKDKDGKVVDVVKIFGYLEGQKKTLAQIISANPRTGRMQQQQAPEITWNRKDNSIETKDVNAVGGR